VIDLMGKYEDLHKINQEVEIEVVIKRWTKGKYKCKLMVQLILWGLELNI
jgi:hypothetical protein